MPTRTVFCEDAQTFLQRDFDNQLSIITSLPNVTETTFEFENWKRWFVQTAALCMTRADPNGAAIFFNSDSRVDGTTFSKCELLFEASRIAKVKLVWHKIVARHKRISATSLFRPSYWHYLAFSQQAHCGRVTTDIFYEGPRLWRYGLGLDAVCAAVEFCRNAGMKGIIDPTCGTGIVLAVANAYGLDAIGNEILPERVEQARTLTIPGIGKHR